MSTMPFYPTDQCATCGAVRPWHHPCACGDPGGAPVTLAAKHPAWTKTERHLYGGQAARVLGETDRAGRLLVELMSGPLTGERRWMTADELRSNADAPQRPTASEMGGAGVLSPDAADVSVQGDSGSEAAA